MKKWFFGMVLVLAILLSVIPLQALALEPEFMIPATEFSAVTRAGNCGENGDNVTWELSFDKLIISGTGNMRNYSSTDLPYWFGDAYKIKTIQIKSGVTSIGDFAFQKLPYVTSVTIPDSVTSIGAYAFWKQDALVDIRIPDHVTDIGSGAFYGCSSLSSITLPASVSSIGAYAFSYCSALTGITIPDGVTSIQQELFYCCSSLAEVTIPYSVASIARHAFSGCSSLKTIHYAGNSKTRDRISIQENNDKLLNAAWDYRYADTDRIIDFGVVTPVEGTVGYAAFYRSDGQFLYMKSVEITGGAVRLILSDTDCHHGKLFLLDPDFWAPAQVAIEREVQP